MSNVKPGDFARIVHPKAGADRGKIVHVNQKADICFIPPRVLRKNGLIWWECTPMSSVSALVPGSGQVIIKSPGSMLPFPDSSLQRIDPPEEDDEQETETEKEVTA